MDPLATSDLGIDLYQNKNLHSAIGWYIEIKHSIGKLLDKLLYLSISYNESVERRAVEAKGILLQFDIVEHHIKHS